MSEAPPWNLIDGGELLHVLLIDDINAQNKWTPTGLSDKPKVIVLRVNGIDTADEQASQNQQCHAGKDANTANTLTNHVVAQPRHNPSQYSSKGLEGTHIYVRICVV
jgi:hypothetical protein